MLFAGGQLTATVNALKSALLHGLQRPIEPCCLLLVGLVEVIVRFDAQLIHGAKFAFSGRSMSKKIT